MPRQTKKSLLKTEPLRDLSLKDPKVLVWIDLEMTGLDPETCAIVQMAVILTNQDLEELAPPLEMTIWQPASVLATMSPFVKNMHTKSGLLKEISRSKLSVSEAENMALSLISKHAAYQKAYLCGNSIWQDRRFLKKYLPALENYLHYRQIDVTSLKLVRELRHKPLYQKPKTRQHTALFDIQESIAELKFYLENP